jgi:hypothetical protein
MADQIVSLHQIGQDGEKHPPVVVIQEDIHPGVASGRDVVDGAWEFDPQWSGHGGMMPQNKSNSKT